MAESTTKEYHRLMNEDDCSETSCAENEITYRSKRSVIKKCMIGFGLCIPLLVSVALNVFLLKSQAKTNAALAVVSQGECPSRWAHLVRNVTKPIYGSTKYGPAKSTPEELDELWNALDVSPGIIRISDDFAEANGLPRSSRFPWDQSQGLYIVGAFHQMHCLKEIYTWMSHHKRGVQPPNSWEHTLHCMDTLLQDVFCHADDTPWYQLPPEPYRQGYAEFQTRQCKSWDALLEWVGDRNSCFHYDTFDENGVPVKDQFEHYKFCPEGSPYTEIMEGYFERKAAKEAKAKAMEST